MSLEQFIDGLTLYIESSIYWKLLTTIHRKPETVGSTTKPTMQRLQRLIDW